MIDSMIKSKQEFKDLAVLYPVLNKSDEFRVNLAGIVCSFNHYLYKDCG